MTFALVLIYALGLALVAICVGAVNRGVESPAMRRSIARGGVLLAVFWPLAFVWIIAVAVWRVMRRKAQGA